MQPKNALYHMVRIGSLQEADILLDSIDEVLFGTEATTFGPLRTAPVERVYFAAQGTSKIVAWANYIAYYPSNIPEKRVPSGTENWKYYYTFGKLNWIEEPIPLKEIMRPSGKGIGIRSGGAFLIIDPLQSQDRISSAMSRKEREELELAKIQSDLNLSASTKTKLRDSRKGQGLFRRNVEEVEKSCRATGLSISDEMANGFLHACHIKPWAIANNQERLDGNNGLLLSPHVHYLFDNGYITFQENGHIKISQKLHGSVAKAWQFITQEERPQFSEAQMVYLRWHWENVFERIIPY